MQNADHILIPLLDGTSCLAQVCRVQDRRALILLTAQRSSADATVKPLPASDVLAAVVIDLDTLTADQWPVVGYDAIPRLPNLTRWDVSADDHLYDPAIVEAFCNAQQGHYPWDGFPDPDFFSLMLLPHHRYQRPPRARMTADFPKPESP